MMEFFTLHELSGSSTAARMGLDNTPTAEARANLTALVENVLDPLRRAWGRPLRVTSGYRCAAVNRAVGGVPTSMHLSGHAADITTGNPTDNRRLYQLAQDLDLPYFELIGRKYDFRWLHLSYNPQRSKRRPS